MTRQTTADDGVLPFDKSDLHEGMGTIERIVALSGYTDKSRNITNEGLCNRCGYDRGIYHSHTEVDSQSIECRECGALLAGWGHDQ